MAEDDPEAPTGDATGDQDAGTEPGVPDSPYPIDEDVEFIVKDELLAVKLRGGPRIVGQRIALDTAATFLGRLDALVYAIAGVHAGRESGRRGRLRRVELGGLALAPVTPGSVVFHFALAADEPVKISRAGNNVLSATEEALRTIGEMLETAALEREEQFLGVVREYGPRVATNLGRLLEVLTDDDVETLWRLSADPKPIRLPPKGALKAQLALERESKRSVDEVRVVGLLYEAHSRKHGFEIAVEEGWPAERIRGTYSPEQRDTIRAAWDRRVEAIVRVETRYVESVEEPFETRYELVDIVRILEDAD